MWCTVGILVSLMGSWFPECLIVDRWLKTFPGSLAPYSHVYYQWTQWGLNSFHVSFLGIMQRVLPFLVELETSSKIATIFICQVSGACLQVSLRMVSVGCHIEGWKGDYACILPWVSSHFSQPFVCSYSLITHVPSCMGRGIEYISWDRLTGRGIHLCSCRKVITYAGCTSLGSPCSC